jgi:hypothetical protein
MFRNVNLIAKSKMNAPKYNFVVRDPENKGQEILN